MASYECRGKNKLWSVRFEIIENGKAITKRLSGFARKKDAEVGYRKFIEEYELTQQRSGPEAQFLTFKQLHSEYADYIKQRNKPSTHYDFLSKSKNHVYPYFENFKVVDITPKIILDWQSSVDKYSYQYKCHLRNCLSGLLTYAEKYYNIPNQLRKVDNFRNLEFKEEMKVWSPEQFEQVMKHIKDNVYKAFYYCLFFTGCRKGEMLATTWKDWNEQDQTLTINKSISKKVTGASWFLTTPKNQSSNRKIKVPSFLFDMLKQVKEQQVIDNVSGDMVFYGSKPLPETCICRYLKNAVKEAKLYDIRIHDFRHSHASYLISQGATIVSVAKRLGHSSITQTLNTYSHLMKGDEDKLVSLLKINN